MKHKHNPNKQYTIIRCATRISSCKNKIVYFTRIQEKQVVHNKRAVQKFNSICDSLIQIETSKMSEKPKVNCKQ